MNKNITICLEPEDFERSWVKVNGKESKARVIDKNGKEITNYDIQKEQWEK